VPNEIPGSLFQALVTTHHHFRSLLRIGWFAPVIFIGSETAHPSSLKGEAKNCYLFKHQQ